MWWLGVSTLATWVSVTQEKVECGASSETRPHSAKAYIWKFCGEDSVDTSIPLLGPGEETWQEFGVASQLTRSNDKAICTVPSLSPHVTFPGAAHQVSCHHPGNIAPHKEAAQCRENSWQQKMARGVSLGLWGFLVQLKTKLFAHTEEGGSRHSFSRVHPCSHRRPHFLVWRSTPLYCYGLLSFLTSDQHKGRLTPGESSAWTKCHILRTPTCKN